MHIIYYYQNFVNISAILKFHYLVTMIYVSSIHFDTDSTGPYITLNDYSPDDPRYNGMWSQVTEAQNLNIKIGFMMGGAGLAYGKLFKNFSAYYPLLVRTIKRHKIQGIDIDIEESVNISDVKMLIRRLRSDFGKDFIITMAPVLSDLQTNTPGLGNFYYKGLYNSPEGKEIAWFNVQSYASYQPGDYIEMVLNGYTPSKLVFGMMSEQYYNDTIPDILETITILRMKYHDFGGVVMWEYFDAYLNNPIQWAIDVART
jgi:hypothetical protein